MKKKILFLIPILVVLLSSVNVSAEVITPAGGWQLDTYQYSEVLNSAGTNYVRTSTSYGFFSNGVGQLYRFGSYIYDNGGCQNDYCLQPNTSYVITFFYKSKDVNFKCTNKNNPDPYLDISYFNASGQKITVSYNDYVSNKYVSCDDSAYTISVVLSLGHFGEDFSHINGFDLWFDINANGYDDARNRGILYTGGGQFGLFGVEVDTDVKSYLDKIEQFIQGDTTNDKLDDVTGAIGDTNNKLDDIQGSISDTNDKLDNVEGAIGETNDKIDDMINADSSATESPDDSGYDDYESAEGDLKDKVNQADLTNLSIGIDSKSSTWVWDTLTRLIQSSSAVFSMIISILSIGVIKLALGR